MQCNKCLQDKPQSEFYKRSGVGGYVRQCKTCQCQYAKTIFRATRFGITLDQYLEMVEAQNSQCAICSKPHSESKWQCLVVDHNHDTGNVRGLICHNCNKGIGHLQDNIEVLKNAVKYLEKYEHQK
jgi:hypothetical protein